MRFVPSKRFVQEVTFCARVAVVVVLVPFLFLGSYSIFLVVSLVLLRDPRYGKFLSPLDALYHEEFTKSPPKSTISATLALAGNVNLSLDDFQTLFRKQVLEAKRPKWFFWEQKRYPELTQYVASVWGIPVWKEEEDFQLCEHIKGRPLEEKTFEDPSEIHEQLLNERFEKTRSPWDIILFRDSSASSQNQTKMLITLRWHHSMGDAQSIATIFTECLGQIKTKKGEKFSSYALAWPTYAFNISLSKSVKHYLFAPIGVLKLTFRVFKLAIGSHSHPWKSIDLNDADSFDNRTSLICRVSKPISMTSLKAVARKEEALVSSIIYSIIGGVIEKYSKSSKETLIAISHRKPGHPDFLTNHFDSSYLSLPVSQPMKDDQDRYAIARARLQECDRQIIEMKDEGVHKYLRLLTYIFGSLTDSLRKIVGVNHIAPIMIANIAGSTKGFDIAGLQCTEWTMSVGPAPGVSSLLFCAYGYKGVVRVAVVAKGTVLTPYTVDAIAQEIGAEFEVLQGK